MKVRAFDAFDRILRFLCAALMGAMTLAVILSVFFRYVLSWTAAWSEELITVFFISTTFLGTAMVSRDDEHINIDFIFHGKSRRRKAIIRLLISIVVILVQIIIFSAALKWIAVSGDLKTPGLEIPFKWLYSLLPASSVLVSLYETVKSIENIAVIASPEAAE